MLCLLLGDGDGCPGPQSGSDGGRGSSTHRLAATLTQVSWTGLASARFRGFSNGPMGTLQLSSLYLFHAKTERFGETFAPDENRQLKSNANQKSNE